MNKTFPLLLLLAFSLRCGCARARNSTPRNQLSEKTAKPRSNSRNFFSTGVDVRSEYGSVDEPIRTETRPSFYEFNAEANGNSDGAEDASFLSVRVDEVVGNVDKTPLVFVRVKSSKDSKIVRNESDQSREAAALEFEKGFRTPNRNNGSGRSVFNDNEELDHHGNNGDEEERDYHGNNGERDFPFAIRTFEVTFSKLGTRKDASGVIVQLNNCHKLQDWNLVKKLTSWIALYTSANPPNKNPCSHPIINAMVAIDNGATGVIFDVFEDQTNVKSLLKRRVESAVDKPIVVIESREFRGFVGRDENVLIFVDIVQRAKAKDFDLIEQREYKQETRIVDDVTKETAHLKWLIVTTTLIVIVAFSLLLILVTFKRFGNNCKSIYCRLKMKIRGNERNNSYYDVGKIMDENLDDQCSICLQDFQIEEIVRTLACNHTFHQDCINKWLFFKKSCPLCIYTIKEVKPKSSMQKLTKNSQSILSYLANKKHSLPPSHPEIPHPFLLPTSSLKRKQFLNERRCMFKCNTKNCHVNRLVAELHKTNCRNIQMINNVE